MILSQTAVYALKAALCLAEAPPERRLRVDDIASRLGVPRNYLSKIMHALARDGVFTSSRGPRGGFALARPAVDVKLSDVVAPFGAASFDSGCLLGRPECSDANPCAAHERWKGVVASVRSFMGDTSIADLATSSRFNPEKRGPHE